MAHSKQQLAEAIAREVSARFAAGQPVGATQSLFYSGMVDRLGIQELAGWIGGLVKETAGGAVAHGATLRAPTAADIVENDLDTAELIAGHVLGEGTA